MSMRARLPGLHENPEDADWLHLTEGERVRWTGRPSRYTIAAALGFALVLAVIGIVLTGWLVPVTAESGLPGWLGYLPLVLTAAGLLSAVATYLNWVRLLYVITDDEIYVKHGLVSRDVTQVPLRRVQNTAYTQSVLQRMLSYGTVEIFTAGTSTEDVVFRDVPRPERVKRILTELIGEQGRADDV